jgi:hypothetical protein
VFLFLLNNRNHALLPAGSGLTGRQSLGYVNVVTESRTAAEAAHHSSSIMARAGVQAAGDHCFPDVLLSLPC